MVGVAQLVRAPGCGPGGRGFKSHRSPHGVWRSPVSAPALGAGGRGFESLHPDNKNPCQYIDEGFLFIQNLDMLYYSSIYSL